MSQTSTPTAKEFDAELRNDDRIEVIEADLDTDNPQHGSAIWWVVGVGLSTDEIEAEIIPEGWKSSTRGEKVIFGRPPESHL